jgi:hypothetical protein
LGSGDEYRIKRMKRLMREGRKEERGENDG